MARKGWNALSSGYKARLQKAGITQADYEAGQSITAARGHLHTPERPSQVKPAQHGRYLSERNRLIRQIVTNKHDFFSHTPGWNPVFNPTVAAQPFYSNPPSLKVLRRWAAITREEWIRAIRRREEAYDTIGFYH